VDVICYGECVRHCLLYSILYGIKIITLLECVINHAAGVNLLIKYNRCILLWSPKILLLLLIRRVLIAWTSPHPEFGVSSIPYEVFLDNVQAHSLPAFATCAWTMKLLQVKEPCTLQLPAP
jgi:hypothetical protein